MMQKEHFEAADKLRRELSAGSFTRLAHYGFVGEDPSKTTIETNAACYYNLNSVLSRLTDRAELFVECSGANKRTARLDNEVANTYLHFVLNHSSWRDCFVDKDADLTFRFGAIISTDISPQLMVSAAILVRYCYEYPAMVKSWYEMVLAGVKPGTALILMHIFDSARQINKTPYFHLKDEDFRYYFGDNHSMMNSRDVDLHSLANIRDNTLIPSGDHRIVREGNGSYRGVTNLLDNYGGPVEWNLFTFKTAQLLPKIKSLFKDPYAEDPRGYPLAKYITAQEVVEYANYLEVQVD